MFPQYLRKSILFRSALAFLFHNVNSTDPFAKPECPENFVYNDFTEHCYRVSIEPKSWTAAEEECKLFGAIIAEPRDEMENFMLIAYVIEKTKLSTMWAPNSENAFDTKDCKAINDTGEIERFDCNEKLSFICQTSTVKRNFFREIGPIAREQECDPEWTYLEETESCYRAFYVDESITWDEANTACEEYAEAQLASIHNTEENKLVVGLIRDSVPLRNYAFIGLKYQGRKERWQWSDASRVDYIRFRGFATPNYERKRCAAMTSVPKLNRNTDYFYQTWFNIDCADSRARAFVCKKNINQRTLSSVGGIF